jgi:hypothetical protein
VQKNVSGQKLICFAFDSTTGLPKAADAANITAYVSKDYGAVTVLGDTSATEMDATNAKGYYLFDLTQAETNADTLLFSAKSSTSNIVVVGAPAAVFTTPANFDLLSVDGSGRVDVIKVNGTSQTARDLGASVLLSVGTGTGQVNLATGKVPATLASTDVTGNVAADVQTIKTQSVTCAAGITVGAFVGNATAALGVDASGRVDLGKWLGTAPLALSSQQVQAVVPSSTIVASVSGAVGLVTAGVTVTTNNDKMGYSLTQAFPSNFSALLISVGGHISNVDTLITYTGDTPQTGDSYARIGAAGAGLTALGDSRITHLDADVTSRLAPTVAGRTLDVSATGEAGLDWANIGAPTTAVALTGTTISTSQAGADTSGTTTLLARLTSTRAGNLDSLDVAVSTRLATAGYTAPPSAAATAAAILTDTSDLGTSGSIGYIIGHQLGGAFTTTSSSVLTSAALANAPAGGSGGGSVTVAGYATGQDPATLVLDGVASAHNTAGSIGALVNAFGGDTSGTTTLLSRIPGTVQPQTGDAYARIGAAGAGLTAVGDTAGTTTLLARLTTLRTSYLDNLSGGAVALAGSQPSWYVAPVDVSANVVAIKAKTDNLPAAPADETLIIAATNSLGGSLTTLLSRIPGVVQPQTGDSYARLGSGVSLTSAGLDTVHVETGLNARQALAIIASACAGVLSGASGTDIAIAAAGVPATNRIAATVDGDGNRTAVTLTPPA